MSEDFASPELAEKALPSAQKLTPAPRRSGELGVMAFLKNALTPIAIATGCTVAGFVIGRFAPKPFLEALQRQTISLKNSVFSLFGSKGVHEVIDEVIKHDFVKNAPHRLAAWGGGIGSVYAGFREWRKGTAKELGVKDIHADLQQAIDPAQLQKEVEQNQRVQDGIRTLMETGPAHSSRIAPRGAYSDAVSQGDAVAQR